MLLALGVIFLVAADIVLAIAGTPWQVFASVALWGLHMGATQGLLSTLVIDPSLPTCVALRSGSTTCNRRRLARGERSGWLALECLRSGRNVRLRWRARRYCPSRDDGLGTEEPPKLIQVSCPPARLLRCTECGAGRANSSV